MTEGVYFSMSEFNDFDDFQRIFSAQQTITHLPISTPNHHNLVRISMNVFTSNL